MKAKAAIDDSLKLIRTIRTSGTVAPSSKGLIRRMLAPVDFAAARCIAELGPGNGCVTRELLERMAPDACLISFEVNDDFAARLRRSIADRRLQIHSVCASQLGEVLAAQGLAKADYVISSLPLAILGEDTVAAILATVRRSLCPAGRYMQYQYSLAHYGRLKALFGQVRLRFALGNIPPAFVYECSR